jgi:hypothetical protein
LIKIYQHFDKKSGGRASRQAGRQGGSRQASMEAGRRAGMRAGWRPGGLDGGVVFRLYRLKYNTKIEEKTGSLTPPTERVHDARYLGFLVHDCARNY